MDTFSQAETFFFISSVGFVLLWIFVAILLFYLIRISRTFSAIMDKLEDNVNKIGDATKEMLTDLRDSTLFNFFLRKRRKSRKD